MTLQSEIFISVDIEASGPIPGEFSMLTLGACVVDREDQTFEIAFKPISSNADPEALAVTGLSIPHLMQTGIAPEQAMHDFAAWIENQAGGTKPVFVGLNAGFDWSFVNYYFHKYLGRNPFGFSALDIKALYMGATDVPWGSTKASAISRQFAIEKKATHIALEDALYQADLFKAVRKFMRAKSSAASNLN